MDISRMTFPYRSQDHYRGLIDYVSSAPDASAIRAHAAEIQRLLQGTHEDIYPVFAQWTGLEDFYNTADTQMALQAQGPASIQLGASGFRAI